MNISSQLLIGVDIKNIRTKKEITKSVTRYNTLTGIRYEHSILEKIVYVYNGIDVSDPYSFPNRANENYDVKRLTSWGGKRFLDVFPLQKDYVEEKISDSNKIGMMENIRY